MFKQYEKLIMTAMICMTVIFVHEDSKPVESNPVTVSVNLLMPEAVTEETDILEIEETVSENVAEAIPAVKPIAITDEEAIELALIATAEAGNQSDYGIRLVIDTVLNRVEDPKWPNNIHDVIHQPNQYYANGMNYVSLQEDILVMVYQEAEARTDTKVKFFARSWPRSGTKYIHEGDHFFNY